MVDRAALIEAETEAERPYDTSDPETVNKARQKAGRQKRSDASVVGALMETKQGRAWIFGILDAAHIYQPSFDRDPHVTAFREGERNLGLRILSEVQSSAPREYTSMIEEAHGRV